LLQEEQERALCGDTRDSWSQWTRVGRGFPDSCLPFSFSVCRHFLLACPEERGRLWEVAPPGAWGQRVNIWLKVQLQQARLPECEWVSKQCPWVLLSLVSVTGTGEFPLIGSDPCRRYLCGGCDKNKGGNDTWMMAFTLFLHFLHEASTPFHHLTQKRSPPI
jgi:hypothetical protein